MKKATFARTPRSSNFYCSWTDLFGQTNGSGHFLQHKVIV